MVTTRPDILAHDLAVLDRLKTIGRPVEFGRAPDGALNRLLQDPSTAGGNDDYMVLYPIAGGSRDGSLEDPYADIQLPYQVTCIGYAAAGVRWMVTRIEPALAGITITGRSIVQIIPDDPGPVRLDEDINPELAGTGLLVGTPRFTLHTTPA